MASAGRTRTAWDVLGANTRMRGDEIQEAFCALYGATQDCGRQEELLDAFEILGSDPAVVDSYQLILEGTFYAEQAVDPQDVYRSSYELNDCRDVTFAPLRLKHKPLAVILQHLRLRHRTRYYGEFFSSLSPHSTAPQIHQAHADTLLGLNNPHFASTHKMTPEEIQGHRDNLEESYGVVGHPERRAMYHRLRRHGYVCKRLGAILVRVVATSPNVQHFLAAPEHAPPIEVLMPPERGLPPIGEPEKQHATRTREDLAQRCAALQYQGGPHAWEQVEFLVEWDAAHAHAAHDSQEATRIRHTWTPAQVQQRLRDLEHDTITPQDFGTSTLTDLQKRIWRHALQQEAEEPAPSPLALPTLQLEAPKARKRSNTKKKKQHPAPPPLKRRRTVRDLKVSKAWLQSAMAEMGLPSGSRPDLKHPIRF